MVCIVLEYGGELMLYIRAGLSLVQDMKSILVYQPLVLVCQRRLLLVKGILQHWIGLGSDGDLSEERAAWTCQQT